MFNHTIQLVNYLDRLIDPETQIEEHTFVVPVDNLSEIIKVLCEPESMYSNPSSQSTSSSASEEPQIHSTTSQSLNTQQQFQPTMAPAQTVYSIPVQSTNPHFVPTTYAPVQYPIPGQTTTYMPFLSTYAPFQAPATLTFPEQVAPVQPTYAFQTSQPIYFQSPPPLPPLPSLPQVPLAPQNELPLFGQEIEMQIFGVPGFNFPSPSLYNSPSNSPPESSQNVQTPYTTIQTPVQQEYHYYTTSSEYLSPPQPSPQQPSPLQPSPLQPSPLQPSPQSSPHSSLSSSSSPSSPSSQLFQEFQKIAAQLPPTLPLSPLPPPTPSSSLSKPSKARRIDHTKEFQAEFQLLLKKDRKIKREWKEFRRSAEGKCTYKWCIRAKREFCRKKGGEYEALLSDARFRGMGTRTNCGCRQAGL